MKKLAPFSLLLLLTGHNATAAEIMPEREEMGLGSMSMMMLGAAAGPAGALVGGLAGVFIDEQTGGTSNNAGDGDTEGSVEIGPLQEVRNKKRSVIKENGKTHVFDGDRSDSHYIPASKSSISGHIATSN